ncbi:MAG: hypothetical protein ACI8O8_002898 [Oleiphilaceae bacterium]|jgi:hypothetical protein
MSQITHADYRASQTVAVSYINSQTETEIDSVPLVWKALRRSCVGVGTLALAASPMISSFMSPDGFGRTDEGVKYIEASHLEVQQSFSTFPVAQIKTEELSGNFDDFFRLSNENEITTFLSLNVEVEQWLLVLGSELSRSHKGLRASVELYKDLEEQWEKIIVMLELQSDDFEETYALETELYDKYIEPSLVALRGRVALTVI